MTSNYSTIWSLVLFLFLAGCSGGGAVSTPGEAIDMPSWNGLATTSDGILLQDVNNGSALMLHRGAGSVHIVSQSADGQRLVFAYQQADSSFLKYFDASTGNLETWEDFEGEARITGAWSADESAFAYGFQNSDASGIAIRDVQTGEMKPAGCSASNQVLAWPAPNELLVASGENVYVVNAANCNTIKALDLRKKSGLSVSRDGSKITYILRELEYNRETRSYEPDSALYLAGYQDTDPVLVAGQRYSPKRMAWSPDGSKLAFDVASEQNEGYRNLAVFDTETGEASFITRPDPLGIPTESSPRWSPDGSFILYDREFKDKAIYQKAARSMVDNALYVLVEGDRAQGKAEIVSWIGSERALVAYGNTLWLVSLQGMPSREMSEAGALFWLPDDN